MPGLKWIPLAAALATIGSRPAAHAPTLVITASMEPSSAAFRVIATGGSLSAGGEVRRVASDTLHASGTAELTTADPIVTATFIADRPAQRIRVTVRQNGVETLQGSGDMIVVFRTPQGAQLQAMLVPPELQRAP